jgi:hypothetical protein
MESAGAPRRLGVDAALGTETPESRDKSRGGKDVIRLLADERG